MLPAVRPVLPDQRVAMREPNVHVFLKVVSVVGVARAYRRRRQRQRAVGQQHLVVTPLERVVATLVQVSAQRAGHLHPVANLQQDLAALGT